MELILIRHGEPRWSVDGLSQIDPYLTERGARQADLTAKRILDGERPAAELLVSPAIRSQETAAPIAAATGLEPQTLDDLVEIRLPDWTGELEETVQRIFAEARDRPPEEWWEGLSGGESFRAFHDRIVSVMRQILADRSMYEDPQGGRHMWSMERDPKRIVIVAHGGTNAVALGFLLGLDPTPWEWERFVLGHASMTRVRAIPLAGGYVFSLRDFNDMEHLPLDMRTK